MCHSSPRAIATEPIIFRFVFAGQTAVLYVGRDADDRVPGIVRAGEGQLYTLTDRILSGKHSDGE